MKKKLKIGAFVADAGETAKHILSNTTRAADQNNDGKFDLKDVAVIANTVGGAAKKGVQAVKDAALEEARKLEFNTLQPIFAENLVDTDFLMSKFIRVTDRDKRRAESEVCQGSIGYFSDNNDFRFVNIFWDSIDAFGLTFYPNRDSEFYYANPSDRTFYIALNEYFNYLKGSRVNELKKIAQDLGAKQFKVIYKEEQASFSEKKGSAHIKVAANIDAEHHSTEKKFEKIDVEAENTFPGQAPRRPQLKYFQGDPNIETLVSMRMDKQSPLSHGKYVLNMSSSSGMKVNDAVKIDAVLKGLKCTGNATVESEVRNESRRYLEYDIEF